MIVLFSCQVVPSCFSCYKLYIFILFTFSLVFPKTALFINIKKSFLKSFLAFFKKNCHNSRIKDDISMKLWPVTKLDKGSTGMSTKFSDNFMSANCYVIVNFLIYSQFGGIRKVKSRWMVCRSYIFINSSLSS